MAAKPPRPPPRPTPAGDGPPTQRTGSSSLFDLPRTVEPEPAPAPAAPAELDAGTRQLLTDAIAKAVAAELGNVRVSSAPPPRSSLRVAAAGTGKLGKWGTMAIGGLAVFGQVIVWFGKPEYAGPIAQALKIIGSMISAAAGGGPPSVE